MNTLTENVTTLWMGDLELWYDEVFIKQIWFQYGQVIEVKLIRDKLTNTSQGYAFIDFSHHQAALIHLETLNNTLIPGTTRLFKLNWATGGGLNDGGYRSTEYNLFVGNIAMDVTDQMFSNLFTSRYKTVKLARIVTDPMTKLSRSYGFVLFLQDYELNKCMIEMNGFMLGSKEILVSTCVPKAREVHDHSMTLNSIPVIIAPPPKKQDDVKVVLVPSFKYGALNVNHLVGIEVTDLVDIGTLNAQYRGQVEDCLTSFVDGVPLH